MRTRKVLCLACLGAALAAPGAFAVAPGGVVPGVAAPRLTEPASRLALKDLRGSVVYVDFWASWCVPCRQSMPQLEALYRKYRDRGFRVVGVNKDVAAAEALRFLDRVKVTFPLVADQDDAVARAFDVNAMPSGYLVDRKGIVRFVHRGFSAETAAALPREIESLLGAPS